MLKTLKLLPLATLAIVGSPSAASATSLPGYAQQAALSGSSGAFFGYSVAIDGDTAVVGAWNDQSGKGAAYVFVRTSGTWSQQQVLSASDGAAGDQFGYAVTVSGNFVLVGAAGRNSSQGNVYSFSRLAGVWSQQQELTAGDGAAGDCFGCSLAIRGGAAIVGAPGKFSQIGAAYAFVNRGSGWQQQSEFLGQSAAEYFGFSVALSSDASTAVVGAYAANTEKGRAYVLTTNGTTWTQQAVLIASDGFVHDRFGYSVAVDNDTAVIGSYGHRGKGSAYVFKRTAGAWSQQTQLLASDASSNADFGYSVAVAGQTAVVGAYEKTGLLGPGAAYIFVNSLGTWVQQEVLASGSGQYFGYSVAASGTTAAVGAFGASSDSGAAYVFASTLTPVPALGDRIALLGFLLLLAGLALHARPLHGDQLS